MARILDNPNATEWAKPGAPFLTFPRGGGREWNPFCSSSSPPLRGRIKKGAQLTMRTTLLALSFFMLLITCIPKGHAAQPTGKSTWELEWERTIKAAEREGEVSYYTVGEYGFVAAFEKKFPRIKVKIVPGRGNDLLSRIMTERRAGKYLADVARIGNTSPYSLYQAKTLQAIASALILPEVRDESKWWQGKHHYVDPESKYIFVPVGSVSANIMAYNTDIVNPDDLNSFWDLLMEKWRGKIVAMDPRGSGYGRSGARFVYYHPTLGPEFLRRLFREANVTLSRDYRQAIDWLAQRRFSLLLFGNRG